MLVGNLFRAPPPPQDPHIARGVRHCTDGPNPSLFVAVSAGKFEHV